MTGKCGHPGAHCAYSKCRTCSKQWRDSLPWTGSLTPRQLLLYRRAHYCGTTGQPYTPTAEVQPETPQEQAICRYAYNRGLYRPRPVQTRRRRLVA